MTFFLSPLTCKHGCLFYLGQIIVRICGLVGVEFFFGVALIDVGRSLLRHG